MLEFFNIFLLPLPWMLGPAFTVALFALSGVHVKISREFRVPFVDITGVWLGSYFQPNILNDINGEYPKMKSRKTLKTKDTRHTIFSFWDTYRNLHALMS